MATTEYGGSIYLGRSLGWVKRQMRYTYCEQYGTQQQYGAYGKHGYRHGGSQCCGFALTFDLDLRRKPDVEKIFGALRENHHHPSYQQMCARLSEMESALRLYWAGAIPQPLEQLPMTTAKSVYRWCSYHQEEHQLFMCTQCHKPHGCDLDQRESESCFYNPSAGSDWGTPYYEEVPTERGETVMANGLETHKLYECAAWNSESGEIYTEIEPRQTALNDTMMKRKLIRQLPEGAADDPNTEIMYKQVQPDHQA